jgi:hypothetical protein
MDTVIMPSANSSLCKSATGGTKGLVLYHASSTILRAAGNFGEIWSARLQRELQI